MKNRKLPKRRARARMKKTGLVIASLVLALVVGTGLVFAANGESYQDFDYDDKDLAFYVPSQPTYSADINAQAEISDLELDWHVMFDEQGNTLHVRFDDYGFKWLHPDSTGMEWFQEPFYYVDSFGRHRLHQMSVFIDGLEWVVFDIDGGLWLSRAPSRPINGMIYASGLDADGNEVIGWVREIDLMAGLYPWLSFEEQIQVQLEQAKEFYETGEYWLLINLYSDTSATEVIGKHKVVVYPDGRATVHGFGGIIYMDRVED